MSEPDFQPNHIDCDDVVVLELTFIGLILYRVQWPLVWLGLLDPDRAAERIITNSRRVND